MSPKRTLKIMLAAALGALAILALPALASAKDRNHDRIPDRWEKRHRLSLNVNQAGRDQDGDHLRNRDEFLAGDNPRDADTDNDGVMDGQENAGTIQSFDPATGKLVIDLFGTGTVSGLVTERTEIKCEEEHSSAPASDSHHGEEPGDDNGGGDNPGPGGQDDNGNGGNCTTADLVPGAVVQEADLQIEHGTASFDEVELTHSN